MILEQAAKRLALPAAFLIKLATTASHRYKVYTIPKKTGGLRTIHHPARELKLVQGWLLQNVLMRLPVHEAATAYRVGSSIRRNAERHVGHNYLLRGDSLTIGAPTSPQLSNAIMFGFDESWSRRVEAMEVAYSRYADDLYFSTNRPNVLEGVLQELRESLQGGGPPILRINEEKTVFSSRKRRRLAAGLVLTSDRKISIGRHKKRVLKSLVWKLKRRELDPHEVASLRGWISYLRSIEPAFLVSLQRKYTLDFDSGETWKT
jgi:hypothetical protein